MKARNFINQLERHQLVAAIQGAEKKTSGEIRVFITRHQPENPVPAAQAAFAHLNMDQTEEKNGVLIFVAPRVRKFAVIGDAGIHTHCGDAFWESVTREMTNYFKQGEFTNGLIHGIQKAGELLAEHFPAKPGDKNQLPDDIAGD